MALDFAQGPVRDTIRVTRDGMSVGTLMLREIQIATDLTKIEPILKANFGVYFTAGELRQITEVLTSMKLVREADCQSQAPAIEVQTQ